VQKSRCILVGRIAFLIHTGRIWHIVVILADIPSFVLNIWLFTTFTRWAAVIVLIFCIGVIKAVVSIIKVGIFSIAFTEIVIRRIIITGCVTVVIMIIGCVEVPKAVG
jgi:hypothetical protein